MRIAPSGRFSREAREPDQHHRSIWLLASPHCPDIQNRQNLGRLGCLSVISLSLLGPRHVWTLCTLAKTT
jgi:hypothetical protein